MTRSHRLNGARRVRAWRAHARSAVAVTVLTGTALIALPASATPAPTLYAYASGTGTPSGCPMSTSASTQCSLQAALGQETAGGTIVLETGDFVGNYVISVAGTSTLEPVTITSSSSATLSSLDGNAGSALGCTTSACNQSVLTIASGDTVDVSDVNITNGESASVTASGGISNNGNLTVSNCIFNNDVAVGGGGAINSGLSTTSLLTVTSSTFNNDVAEGDGGAIESGVDGTVTISQSTFDDNSVSGNGGAVSLSGLGVSSVSTSTFANNSTGASGENGGAIASGVSGGGSLVVTSDVFDSNEANANGGAIINGGTLQVSASQFNANTAATGDGGAIDSADDLTSFASVSTSSFDANTAADAGGAIDNGDNSGNGTLTVSDSLFYNNLTTDFNGGAIDNGDDGGYGALTVSASTFVGNAANNNGASLDNADFGGAGTVTLVSSTIVNSTATTNNLSPAALFNGGGQVVLLADILADHLAGTECAGNFVDDGYNVSDDASCELTSGSSVSGASYMNKYLGELGNYGGPTETVPLLGVPWSITSMPDPAVNAVPSSVLVPASSLALCAQSDQRGVTRASTNCSIGAFELDQVTLNVQLVNPGPVFGQSIGIEVTVAGINTTLVPSGDVTISDGVRECHYTLTTAYDGFAECYFAEARLGEAQFIASYSGDDDFAPASATTNVTIWKASTVTAVTLSRPTIRVGAEQKETLSVHVTTVGVVSPTGAVVISAGNTRVCVVRLAAGKASCAMSAKKLRAGHYLVSARYAGTLDLNPSVSSTKALTIS